MIHIFLEKHLEISQNTFALLIERPCPTHRNVFTFLLVGIGFHLCFLFNFSFSKFEGLK